MSRVTAQPRLHRVVTERALVGTCRATLSFVEECEPEFIQTRAFRACDAEIVDVAADEKLVNFSVKADIVLCQALLLVQLS